MQLLEGKLLFRFTSSQEVIKYDDIAFYRHHLAHISAVKAVDFLCLDLKRYESLFVEVKDYSDYKRQKTIDIADEVAYKVLASISGVTLLSRATEQQECPFAKKFMQYPFRIVLHYEDRRRRDLALKYLVELKLKLKRKLQFIDHHLVVENSEIAHYWQVQRTDSLS